MVARYRELVGKGHIVELTGVGHYPQIEAPDLVLEHYTQVAGRTDDVRSSG